MRLRPQRHHRDALKSVITSCWRAKLLLSADKRRLLVLSLLLLSLLLLLFMLFMLFMLLPPP